MRSNHNECAPWRAVGVAACSPARQGLGHEERLLARARAGLYLQHFSDVPLMEDQLSLWNEKGNQLLTDLLYEMSLVLKFNFDKVSLQQNVYSPQAHIDFETDQFILRKFFIAVMSGKRPLWITTDPPADPSKHV